MQEILINKNDSGQRIDKFLTKKYKNMPMSMMYKLIRKKDITVNRKRIKENYILSEGDIVVIYAPDDVLSAKPVKKPLSALGKIQVAYEDENILIADKESGLLVHSDTEDAEDTLIDRIIAYLANKGEYDPKAENSFVPALCNRIDRNTEGLVIAAKNAAALRDMNEIIKERKIEKLYLAAVHGAIQPKSGEIVLKLEKDSKNNIVRVSSNSDKAKTAITRYTTVDYSRRLDLSLVEIELITGRTHQIRASFAHIGHPLLGDGKYAVNKKDRDMGYKSQALCAYSITFKGCKKSETLCYLDGLTVRAKKPRFIELF